MWQCPKCQTAVETSFEVCWNCGTSKDGVEDPTFRSVDEADTPSKEADRPQFGLWSLLVVVTALSIMFAAICSGEFFLSAPVFVLVGTALVFYVGVWCAYALVYLMRRHGGLRRFVGLGAALTIVHVFVVIAFFTLRAEYYRGPAAETGFDCMAMLLVFPYWLWGLLVPPLRGDVIYLFLNSALYGFGLAAVVQLTRRFARRARREIGD